jgi:hypothetical protein
MNDRSSGTAWITRVACAIAALVAAGSSRATAQPMRAVSWGCNGGVTGGGSRSILTREGALSRTSRRAVQAPAESVYVRSDTALARDVFRRLEAMRFLQIRYSKPGNMTCHVAVVTDSGTHDVAWGLPDSQAPASVRALFARLQDAARQPVAK